MADDPVPPQPLDEVEYVPLEEQWVPASDRPTANPDGVTMTNTPYEPATQEEKADRLLVEMVKTIEDELSLDPLDAPNEPYPTGNPATEEDAFEMLKRIHSPMELVPEADRLTAQERNLRAGGSVELDEARELRTGL